ncbi:MAG: hypothetical protein WAT71_04670 [Ignavibacteria bacterium]
MKKNKFLSLTIFISIITISFFEISCDNATGPVSDVSGVIYNDYHHPLSNIKVSTQGRTIRTLDDGRFNFSGISIPYDLTVSDSSFNSKTDLYKNLSAAYIELSFDKYPINNTYATLNITIPSEIIQQNVICKVIYSDNDFTNVYGNILSPEQTITLQIPVFNNVIKGKIYVITYLRDVNLNILSYENYGSSPEIELNNGDVINYLFTKDQLSLNPGEIDAECTLELIYPNVLSYYYISFSQKNYSVSSIGISELTGNYLQFKIPTGIPDTYYNIVNSWNYNIANSGGSVIINPNTSNYLKMNEPCEILTPVIFKEIINSSTPFSFSSGEGSGIYEIELFNNVSHTTYRIFTSENNFTFDWLEDSATEDFSGDNFTWNVTKKGPFSSINDFAVNYFNIPTPFKTNSENGYFIFE